MGHALRARARFLGFLAFALAAVVAWSMLAGPVAARAQEGDRRLAPELAPNRGWLNTDRPLRLGQELDGHVVLLDFWTYCCINCMHVLPDLEYLEHRFADEPFVVVGVHSAKFTTEQQRRSIRAAMRRYDIAHPVVIDDEMRIWRAYGARAWPTFVLIGSDGKVVGAVAGEGHRELLETHIERALRAGRERGDLAQERFEVVSDASVPSASGLGYPGKVLWAPGAGEGDGGGLLFVADSSHDRVLALQEPDELGRSAVVARIGTGERGLADGPASSASFHDPQGMAYDSRSGTLYVADTKNHAIRAVDTTTWEVRTLVGTGQQGRDRVGGGVGTEQPIASPWDVALSHDGRMLYIAMAGTHQIWETDLETLRTQRLAGSGRENSYDGPLDEAALAQPSGLALSGDGKRLYFADSESSSIRVVDLDADEVRTIVGYDVRNPFVNGLFEYGDIDGAYPKARLQHPLGVAVLRGDQGDGTSDSLLVADTYNDKLKLIDVSNRTSRTWAGTGRDEEPAPGQVGFFEPAGLDIDPRRERVYVADTNNHRVLMADIGSGRWREVVVAGLATTVDGQGEPSARVPSDAVRATIAVDATRGFDLSIAPELPEGAKVNPEFPASVRVLRLIQARDGGGTGTVREPIAQWTRTGAALPIVVDIPGGAVAAGDRVLVEMSLAYCFNDEGVCLPGDASWVVRVDPGDGVVGELTGAIGDGD